jgi:dolichol kinase
MAWDFKKELHRKAVHLLSISFIIIFIVISETYEKQLALLVLAFILILFLEMEYFRLELRKKIPFFHKMWRSKEKSRVGGQVFFLIGAIICFSIFDIKIAIAAVLMTTFGDMAAALVGKRFGKIWITKDRALEGIIAELAVDLIICFIVLNNWIIIILMALTATIVETVVDKMDDNLMIPLFSGFAGEIALLILKTFKG